MSEEAYHDIPLLPLPRPHDSHGDLHTMTLEEAITQPFTEKIAQANLDISIGKQRTRRTSRTSTAASTSQCVALATRDNNGSRAGVLKFMEIKPCP